MKILLSSNTICKYKYLTSELYLIRIANTLKIRQCHVYVTYVICCHTHIYTCTYTHMYIHMRARTHMHMYIHTHTCTYTCACAHTHAHTHTHSDLQWNIQMVFPLSFSPGIFEGLAHVFSRLFSFLFYISNARISNFNFASISIHCKYIKLRFSQIQLHWNYCKKYIFNCN